MSRARVLIVEDHPVLGAGIERFLSEAASEWDVCGRAATAAEAAELAEKHKPDLVLLDLSLPDGRGEQLIPRLQQASPACRVVILTMHADESSVMGSIRAGARGYALKNQSMEETLSAMRAVHQGGTYLSPEVSRIVLGRIAEVSAPAKPSLNPSEVRVLQCIAQGQTTSDIALALGLQVGAVRGLRAALMRKLGLANAAEATRAAAQMGLILRKSTETPDEA